MSYTKDQKRLILVGYLKWKKPKDIANLINVFGIGEVSAFDIHNYIQKNKLSWTNKKTYCAHCNVEIREHPRCPHCTRLLHGDTCDCTL